MSKNLIIYNKNEFKIESDYQLTKLKKDLFQKNKIIIVKNVFRGTVNKILNIAKLKRMKPRFKKNRLNSKDLFVFNRNNKKSKVSGYYKKVLLYPWNKENLKYFNIFKKYFILKRKIEKNILKRENIFFDNNNSCVIQIMNYPKNEGFLIKHQDSKFKKKCIIQICTKKAEKFSKGGLIIYKKKDIINADNIMNKGDLMIFSSSLFHSVAKDLNDRNSIILAEVNIS